MSAAMSMLNFRWVTHWDSRFWMNGFYDLKDSHIVRPLGQLGPVGILDSWGVPLSDSIRCNGHLPVTVSSVQASPTKCPTKSGIILVVTVTEGGHTQSP